MLVRPILARPRKLYSKILVAVLAGALSLGVVSAAAAEGPLASLDITLLVQSEGGGEPLLLVAGQLPEGTQLPAELVLPVPEGSVVEWSGEILGEAVDEDEEAPATIEVRDGVTVAVLDMSKSLVGQVEVSFPGAITPAGDGTFTGGFTLTAPSDIEMIRVAIGLAPGTQAVELPDGVLSAQGPQGYTYYYQELGPVSEGDPIEFSMQYRETGAPAAGDTGSSQPASGEVPPLLIALVAAVLGGAALMLVVSRFNRGKNRQGNEAPDGEDRRAQDQRRGSAHGPTGPSTTGGGDRPGTSNRRRPTYRGRVVEDYYAILEVSPTARPAVITRAYKALMLEEHPDQGGETVKAQLINEAFEVLSDPVKRRQYDSENGYA